MGIRFIDSILALLTVCCVVFSSYFVGHGLSIEHPGSAWITAAVLAAVGVALGFLTTRRIADYARRHDHHRNRHTHAH